MKQYKEKYDFINKALLESVAQTTEMTKTDHPMAAARVISVDKMVMLPPLFDGSKPEVTATKVIITKAIVVYIITHIETINKVIIMANLEAEAVVMAEVIFMDTVTVGLIIKAITFTSTRQINMVHHVHYAVAIITPPNIVLRENMILMTLWRK